MTYLTQFREFERSIITKHGKPDRPIIAIGGWAGTGKDTAAYNLQRLLKEKDKITVDVHVAGDFFRAKAKEAGYNERELEKFSAAVKSDELDVMIDKATLEMALTKGGIFVGRMAPAVIGEHGIKVWIETDPKVVAERVSSDPKRKEFGMPIDELARRGKERNEKDAARYKRIYGIDPEKMKSKYDLVLNNSHYTKEQTANKLHEFVIARLKGFK